MITVVAAALLFASPCAGRDSSADVFPEACRAGKEDVQEPELGASLMQVTQAFVKGRGQASRQVVRAVDILTREEEELEAHAKADAAWCLELLRGLTPVPAWPTRMMGTCQAVFSNASACREAAAFVLDQQSSFPEALEKACGVLDAAAKSKLAGKEESFEKVEEAPHEENEGQEEESLTRLKRRRTSQASVRSSVEVSLVSKGNAHMIAGPPYPNLTCTANMTNSTNNQTGVANISTPIPNTTIEPGCWIYEDAQDTTTSTTTTTVTTTIVANASNSSNVSNASNGSFL